MSEALKGFALPAMSEAMAADEKERKAMELFESVKSLARATGAKVEIK